MVPRLGGIFHVLLEPCGLRDGRGMPAGNLQSVGPEGLYTPSSNQLPGGQSFAAKTQAVYERLVYGAAIARGTLIILVLVGGC